MTLWCALLLAVVVAWNVRSVVGFDFVAMDDDINVYFNPHLGPPNAATLKWMLSDASYVRRYLPLGWLTFSAVYEFSGLSPTGYHVANLALHVVNTLLLFALARCFLRRWGGATDEVWTGVCAALGAGLWALHPYRAETVGWVSGLLYGPSATFSLLAVWAYLKVLDARVGASARAGWLWLTGAAYLASMLVYPVSLGLIGVFVMLDCAKPPRRPVSSQKEPPKPASLKRLAFEKIMLTLPAAGVLAITVVMRVVSDSYWAKPVSLEDFGWVQRGAQACYALAHYLICRWWPVGLTPAPTRLLEVNASDLVFVSSAIFVLGGTVFMVWCRAWRRNVLLWWLSFLILLIPLLGFMEHPYFACDRYDYLAGMVISLAVSFALLRLPLNLRPVTIMAFVAALGGLAWRQQEQLQAWKNTDTLERCMIENSDSVAFRAMQYGRWAEHLAAYGEPKRAAEILAEGERRCGSGQWSKEVREEIAKAASPTGLHTRLAMDFSRAGRTREAREHFRRALRFDTGLAATGINYAVLLAVSGEPSDALHWYFRAVAGSRDGVPAATRSRVLGLIAESFFSTGQVDIARRATETALRDAPSSKESQELQLQLSRYRDATGVNDPAKTRE